MKSTERTSRKYAKLIRFLNSKLDSTNDRVAMAAAERLTEIFLKQEETKQKEIDRQARKIRAQAAQDELQAVKLSKRSSAPKGEQDESAGPKDEGPESADAKLQGAWDAILEGKRGER